MKKVISFDKEILFPTMIGEITAISLDQTLKFLSKSDIEGDFIISGRYKMTEASAIEEEFKYTLPIEITLLEAFTLNTTKIEIQDFYYEVVDEEVLKVKIDILVEGVEEVLLEEETVEDAVDKELEKMEEEKVVKQESRLQRLEREEGQRESSAEETKIEVIKSTSDDDEIRENRECDGEEKDIEEKMTDIEPVLPPRQEEKEKIEKEEKKEILEEKIQSLNTTNSLEEKPSNIQSIFRVFNDAEETYKAYTVYIMRKNDSIATVLDRYKITKEQLEEYNDLSQIELGSKVIIPATND